MDMNWLDDVLILLEEGNMTRAAARRNITQPAFSRRIRSFENWLGVRVLDRGTNKINITPTLRSNESEIRALVTRINDLKGKLAHYDPASTIVSIAAQHSPIFYCLSRHVTTCKKTLSIPKISTPGSKS